MPKKILKYASRAINLPPFMTKEDFYPCLITTTSDNEAYSVLVSEIKYGMPYGYTLLYYKKGQDGWKRWALEKQGVTDAVWIPVDEPFGSIPDGFAYEARIRMLFDELSEKEKEVVKNNPILNMELEIHFGRYDGMTFREMLEADRRYSLWAIQNIPGFEDDIIKRNNYCETRKAEKQKGKEETE